MATNVDGIIGYNSPSGTNKLMAAYGNDIVDVLAGTGFGLNISSGNVAHFEVFIDTIFFTNGVDPMRTYVGGKWSNSYALPKQLVPKYIKKAINNAQLLVGNCILTPGSGSQLNYKSYVFKSNFATFGKSPSGAAIAQTLTWGLESGKCAIDQLTKQVRAIPDANGKLPYFISNGIKVGDPFFLVSGNDIGQYSVASVDGEYVLTLNEAIPSNTNTSVDFWVGRNWFQVGTDDNDQITGFGENTGRDLIFKKFSVWYYAAVSSIYSVIQELKQIKGAPGTNDQRSVINDTQGNTYWFHGSDIEKTGIYRYDGSQVVKVSRAIDTFLQGMSASNYGSVVAWQEGDELRWFLGNLTNTDENISMTNAVATLNTITNAWDVSPLNDIITCATTFIQNNINASYCGTSGALILQMNNGNSFNNQPMTAALETGVKYPAGSGVQCIFPAIQAIGKNVKGLRLSYKLWNMPANVDDSWIPLGELRADKTEFLADKINKLEKRQASGIQFRVEEAGSLSNTWLMEKITVFYKPDTTRMV